MRRQFAIILVLTVWVITFLSPTSVKAEGHYQPGIANIRDYVLPPPGFYLEVYNSFYYSTTLKNRNGDTVNNVNVGGRTVNLNVDARIYTLAPSFIWALDTGLWGLQYGGMIIPTFGNTSIGASLETERRGVSSKQSQFNVGDLYVEPLWVARHFKHVDIGFNYGFYAPVGKYSANASDNVGLGFWSHQLQLAAYFYPWEHQKTAFMLLNTFEINQRKRDTNFTAGDMYALEFAVSHYFTERFEAGISWYSMFQITDDKNETAAIQVGKEQVHAAGAQIGYWILKDKLNITARYMGEFLARSRFQGHLVALNLTWVIHNIGVDK